MTSSMAKQPQVLTVRSLARYWQNWRNWWGACILCYSLNDLHVLLVTAKAASCHQTKVEDMIVSILHNHFHHIQPHPNCGTRVNSHFFDSACTHPMGPLSLFIMIATYSGKRCIVVPGVGGILAEQESSSALLSASPKLSGHYFDWQHDPSDSWMWLQWCQ